jgi:uncharacterized protein YggE
MRVVPDSQPMSRLSFRPFLVGAIVVVLAIAGLALLSEAFASGGQTVYLANIEPGDNGFPTQPSIVVTGLGSASAPAEQAVIQLLIVRAEPYSSAFASDTPVPTVAAGAVSTGSLAPVVAAIEDSDVDKQAIRVVSSPSLISVCSSSASCSAVRIEVIVDQPNLDQINAIINAAGEAAGSQTLTVQDVGVGYRVADCHALHDLARADAAADARSRADAQAVVLGVKLGNLVVSTEEAPPEPEDDNGCAPLHGSNSDAWWTPGSVGLTTPAFDPQDAPEVVVRLQLSLAYAIVEPEA